MTKKLLSFLLVSLLIFNIPLSHFSFADKNGEVPDGEYVIPVQLLKAGDLDSKSMANKAMKQKAVLKVENGKWYVFPEFKTLLLGSLQGNASNIRYYTDYENSVLKKAQIISYRNDPTGKQQVKVVKIPVNKDKNGIYLKVYVDAMGYDPDVYLTYDASGLVFEKEYTITSSAESNGSIDPEGDVVITEGDNRTFNIAADKGYSVKDVLVDGKSVGAKDTYTFENVTSDHTISATFKKDVVYHRITVNASSNGSIEPKGDAEVKEGENATFDITADTGYHIKDVLVDGKSIGIKNSYTFENVTSDHTINAIFEKDPDNKYIITASYQGEGTINPSDNVELTEGEAVMFRIMAADGYHIKDVLVDGKSVGAKSTYAFNNVKENHTISAVFEKDMHEYTIKTTSGSHGGIEPGGDVTLMEGENHTFEILPDDGYHVKDVLVDGKSIGIKNSYTFENVTSDHTISATFEKDEDKYTIKTSSDSHGSLSPKGTVEVLKGEDKTFTITADTGYHIKDVLVDGKSIGIKNSYTFENVTTNHMIRAVFEKDIVKHIITVEDTSNGSISPKGKVSVADGDDKQFSITADKGYYLKDVLVDGKSVGARKFYTFKKVMSNHTIKAIFKKDDASSKLEDGKYKLPIQLMKANNLREQSMAAGAINKNAIVQIENGKWYLLAEFKTLKRVGLLGNASNIRYYVDYDNGVMKKAEILSYRKDPTGKKQVKVVKIPITKNDNGLYVRMFVDAMGVEADAYVKFDMNDLVIGKKSHMVIATSNTGGTISPRGGIRVKKGDSITLNIKPESGFRIKKVIVDDRNVGKVSSYTFNNIRSNHKIDVKFERINTIKYTIKTTVIGKGSIGPSGKVTVNEFDNKTFTIQPEYGYKISYLKIDGVDVGARTKYTFKDIQADHKIEVKFEKEKNKKGKVSDLSKDGTYYVNVDLYNASANRPSMASPSIVKRTKIVVQNGNAVMYLRTNPMRVGSIVASLQELYIGSINGGYRSNPALVVQKDSSGNPSLWKFGIPKNVKFIDVVVNPHVDAMGNTDIPARIMVDYSTLEYDSESTAQMGGVAFTQSKKDKDKKKDKKDLNKLEKNGTYEVAIDLYHAVANKPSMASPSIVKKAKIVYENGTAVMYMGTKPMTVGNIEASLLELYIGDINGDYKSHPASIVEKDANGRPTLWKFIIPENVEFVNIVVNPHVDAMGNTDIPARIMVDYSTLEYISDSTKQLDGVSFAQMTKKAKEKDKDKKGKDEELKTTENLTVKTEKSVDDTTSDGENTAYNMDDIVKYSLMSVLALIVILALYLLSLRRKKKE